MKRGEIAQFKEVEDLEIVVPFDHIEEIAVSTIDSSKLEMSQCGRNVLKQVDGNRTCLNSSWNSHDERMSSSKWLCDIDGPLEPSLIHKLLKISCAAQNSAVYLFAIITWTSARIRRQTFRDMYFTE